MDLCRICLTGLGIKTIDREDLRDESNVQKVWDFEDECGGSEELYEDGLSFEGENENSPFDK